MRHVKDEELAGLTDAQLRRVAGDKSPAPPADDKPAARAAFVLAWEKWWRDEGKGIDLAKVAIAPPALGLVLGIEYNTNDVWEAGPDRKRRWTVKGEGPMDARVLPGNRVLIAESTGKAVRERDIATGKVLWEQKFDEEPVNCERLADGTTWIGTRRNSVVVKRDNTVVASHVVSADTINSIRRSPRGHVVAITIGNQLVHADAAGKLVRKVELPKGGNYGDAEILPSGNYLATDQTNGRIVELNPKGDVVRKIDVPAAFGQDRLPGGGYVIATDKQARLVDAAGKTTWEMASDGYVRRAHRR